MPSTGIGTHDLVWGIAFVVAGLVMLRIARRRAA